MVMTSLKNHILLVAALMVAAEAVVEEVGVDVGVMVGQLVEHHLTGCHLVLVTATQQQDVPLYIMRHLSVGMKAGVVVEAGWVFSQDQLDQDHLLQGLWGDARATCRALILDLTTSNSTDLVLRFTEAAGLWKRSLMRVVVVGGKTTVEEVLLHHSLRNTLHALYLALHDLTLHIPPRHGNSRLRKVLPRPTSLSERVWVYRRCMYCNNGEADVLLIHQYNSTSFPQPTDNLFQEQVKTFNGRQLRIVAVRYFPYMDYEPLTDQPGGFIKPKDSIDTRLIHTFTALLNFTFEIREEPQKLWGRKINGSFIGMVGQLEREETDFCTISGPATERMQAVQYLGMYPSDMMTTVSLKPSLLPLHLSLIRPFEGELWFALLVSVVAWGILMWLLQRTWVWFAGGRSIKLSNALLDGWGMLLDQTLSAPTFSDSARLLVGWWLVYCEVISTGYRSSLVAHMTIQGRTLTIDTFEDVVQQNNWRWGVEPWIFKGNPYEYFSRHIDPVVQKLYKHMEMLPVDEALQEVLKGSFTLLHLENYVSIIVASRYTDARGDTPFYISKKGVTIIGSYGWSFRMGAPFYQRFLQVSSHLENAGIISYWTKQVIARRVKENRAAAHLDSQVALGKAIQDDNKEIPLRLQHMQGAFYLLFLGSFVALLILLMENLTHS